MIATPIIMPVTSQNTVVSNTGCPEDKPYYIEVSSDAWKCSTETEYQEYKKVNSTAALVFIGIMLFITVAIIIAVARI
jgi:hypothetical protein